MPVTMALVRWEKMICIQSLWFIPVLEMPFELMRLFWPLGKALKTCELDWVSYLPITVSQAGGGTLALDEVSVCAEGEGLLPDDDAASRLRTLASLTVQPRSIVRRQHRGPRHTPVHTVEMLSSIQLSQKVELDKIVLIFDDISKVIVTPATVTCELECPQR